MVVKKALGRSGTGSRAASREVKHQSRVEVDLLGSRSAEEGLGVLVGHKFTMSQPCLPSCLLGTHPQHELRSQGSDVD